MPICPRPLHVLWAGIVVEGLSIALMSSHGNFLEPGESTKFVAFAAVAGAGFWLAVRGFRSTTLSIRAQTLWFWIVALALRLVMLPTYPGDDLWRYRWEGEVQLHGFNPYLLSPDSAALAGLRDARWNWINHRDVPAIYPPLCEMVFALLARSGNSIWTYKVLFASADLGGAVILRSLLLRRGSSLGAAAWYAWNPLVVYAGAGAAHFDSLMVLALLGAIWCLDRLTTRTVPVEGAGARRSSLLAWSSSILLGGAVALKAVPAVLLPVWCFALGWRRALVALPLAAGLPLGLALLYGFPGVPVFGALRNFAGGFQVNNVLWWMVDPAGRWGGAYAWVTVAMCVALASWLRCDWRRAMLWTLGATLLLSPALHAWYVLWVLPLAVWRGESASAWIALSVSVFGYFLLWDVNAASGRDWQEPLWLRLLIYLPPAAVLAWQFVVHRSDRADEAR